MLCVCVCRRRERMCNFFFIFTEQTTQKKEISNEYLIRRQKKVEKIILDKWIFLREKKQERVQEHVSEIKTVRVFLMRK